MLDFSEVRVIHFLAFSQAAESKEHNVQVDVIDIANNSIRDGSKKGDGFACEIAAVQFQPIFNGQMMEKNYIAKYVAPIGNRAEMLKLVKYIFLILLY